MNCKLDHEALQLEITKKKMLVGRCPGCKKLLMPGYLCPECGMVSFNINDIINRYCGKCHKFEEI